MMKNRVLFLFLWVASYAWGGTSYVVRTASELRTVCATAQAGDTVSIEADLVIPNQWAPIDKVDYVIAGNHHLVQGLSYLSSKNGAGLFARVAPTGQVRDLAIVGGRIAAPNARCVGALAGVNEGVISGCWSMARIATAGNVVGGLVGENRGLMEDVYASSLVQANDTIGSLVGMNSGRIVRAYSTGYAPNGYGFVGCDQAGSSYDSCYYDRKLYYQEPGYVGDGLTPIDQTSDMFTLFSNHPSWNVAADRYPILAGFAGSDAALLSAAPAWVDQTSTDPVNHLNDLTENFTVSTAGGIEWRVQTVSEAEWIQIAGDVVTVHRPCTPSFAIVDVKMGDTLTHEVYMAPRRLEDLLPGTFYGQKSDFCHDDVNYFLKYHVLADGHQPASEGTPDYFYTVCRYAVTGVDTVLMDTLISSASSAVYNAWYDQFVIPMDQDGTFVLRRFVHDEGCILDNIRSLGEWVYEVLPDFWAGQIQSTRDTVYLEHTPITISGLAVIPAHGGKEADIQYAWFVNGVQLQGENAQQLSGYDIYAKGTYIFTRKVKDDFCSPDFVLSEGAYVLVVLDTIKPGYVLQADTLRFCTLSEAQAVTISCSQPSGGTGSYLYRWYQDADWISGATTPSLTLTGYSFEKGRYYTFYREVKDDSRFTTWKRSYQSMTIYIYKDINPGSIPSQNLGTYCWPATALSTAYSLYISGTPAAATDGDVAYQWYRVLGTDTVKLWGQTACDLVNYEVQLRAITQGAEYSYIRYARHAEGCEWLLSPGEVKQTYERGYLSQSQLSICSSQMPYTYRIQDKEHTFTYDGEKYAYPFVTAAGCDSLVELTAHVVSVPDIVVESTTKICQSDEQIYIYFGLNNRTTADYFHITYSPDLAKYIGAADTTGIVPAPTRDGEYCIVLRDMPFIGKGDIYLLLQVGSENTECMSTTHRISFDLALGGYLHEKFGRVLYIDNNPYNGEVPGDKLRFISYRWFREGVEQYGHNLQYYDEAGAPLLGTYYAIVESVDHVFYQTCTITMNGQAQHLPQSKLVVSPSPAAGGSQVSFEAPGEAVSLMIVSLTGECVSRQPLLPGQHDFVAPSVPGMYTLHLMMQDASQMSAKFMVR